METIKAYKVALDPTRGQVEALERHAGAARWAYNWAIGLKRQAHQAYNLAVAELTYTQFASLPPDQALDAARGAVKASKLYRAPTRNSLCMLFTRVRGDATQGVDGVAPWWRDVNRYAITSGFADADTAWANWQASLHDTRDGPPVGYPRFHKKATTRKTFTLYHDVNHPTIRIPDSRHVRLPTIGIVRLTGNARRLRRRINRGQAVITAAHVSHTAGRWWVALAVREQHPDPVPTRRQTANDGIGVDIGVHHLAAYSDGTIIDNPRNGQHAADRLARAQRHLARCQKGSANYRKTAARVAKLRGRLAEQRSQTLHRLTKQLATHYATVAIETLDVAGMTRSAHGTIDQPGRRVAQKAGRNREILDVGFGEFARQLRYKTSWYGSDLITSGRWDPTSKTCSNCGAYKADLTLNDRTYSCPACGAVLDRDVNAARNILTMARRAQAGGGETQTPATVHQRHQHVLPDTPGKGESRGEYRDAYGSLDATGVQTDVGEARPSDESPRDSNAPLLRTTHPDDLAT